MLFFLLIHNWGKPHLLMCGAHEQMAFHDGIFKSSVKLAKRAGQHSSNMVCLKLHWVTARIRERTQNDKTHVLVCRHDK